mmetsp:Transcript_52045/g.110588  ORF Transcript_52045/g.110588 Transcript_52045/m.110588 type:complete len:342 (-) Transcript_52045:404-1429(-)
MELLISLKARNSSVFVTLGLSLAIRRLHRIPHEPPHPPQLLPDHLRRGRAVQVHDGHVLLSQEVDGQLVILVVRPYPAQRRVDVVVGASTAPPAREDALDEDRVVAVEVERQLRPPAQGDEILRVLGRPREPVEQYPLPRVVLHSLLHERHDHGGGDKAAALHYLFRVFADGSPGGDFRPQEVAAGQVDDSTLLDQSLAQETFARTRAAHQQNHPSGATFQEQISVLKELVLVNHPVLVAVDGLDQLSHHRVRRILSHTAEQIADVVPVEGHFPVPHLGVLVEQVDKRILSQGGRTVGAPVLGAVLPQQLHAVRVSVVPRVVERRSPPTVDDVDACSRLAE